MSPDHVIDASGINPILGPYRPVDRRTKSNTYDMWEEYLCVQTVEPPALVICVFEALSEPPSYWFDEDGELCPNRTLNGRLFAPAFHEGIAVSGVDSFVCGPLVVSPDGDVATVTSWDQPTVAAALEYLSWPTSDLLIPKILNIATTANGPSVLPEGLISAYLNTDYIVRSSDSAFSLHIGESSQELAALFEDAERCTCAFVTAWNPEGEITTEADNHQCNRLLRHDLGATSAAVFDGVGVGSDNTWQPEESYLGVGLSFDQAVHLGRHYRQNAIVWVECDCIPKLVLLR